MMENRIVLFVFAFLLNSSYVTSLWSCNNDQDCAGLSGSICNSGSCECRPGQQAVLGGSTCVDISPYLESPCVEDHQCFNLFSGYHCRPTTNETGVCFCQDGHHYFHGRCWRSLDFGDPCSRSEQCLGVFRDPFALTCNGTCQCSGGYYERQSGECRKYSLAPGEGCVLDTDCRFPGGACNASTFSCFEGNPTSSYMKEDYSLDLSNTISVATKSTSQRIQCNSTDPCDGPFECSNFGVCVCPAGYYESGDGSMCYAELGSPSTPEQCVGLLAIVLDGICSCRPNFYYDDNMKDCIRVTRRLTDSCVNDVHCHTFGAAARCGAPTAPWGLRRCECIPETSVWDESQQLCRYFSGIGESCQADSDCLAGNLEIRCVLNDEGVGLCACPEHLVEIDGLCLTTGLELGDTCQHTFECTGTNNTVCDGVCSCAEGYRNTSGVCAPVIGGSCSADSDCVIENTVCTNGTTGFACRCGGDFVEYDDSCWPKVPGFNSTCAVTAQCQSALGEGSACSDSRCECIDDYHYRDEGCWPITALNQPCRSSSQCYLEGASERVVCRNSLCQCEFRFSQEQNTCLTSKATTFTTSAIIVTFIALLLR